MFFPTFHNHTNSWNSNDAIYRPKIRTYNPVVCFCQSYKLSMCCLDLFNMLATVIFEFYSSINPDPQVTCDTYFCIFHLGSSQSGHHIPCQYYHQSFLIRKTPLPFFSSSQHQVKHSGARSGLEFALTSSSPSSA